jgi:four helix bundle protein
MDKTYMDVEDLKVYQRICMLHIEVCDLSHEWPQKERYELGSQVRRFSNSSPAQLAEKHDDRHIRNKIEDINRSRGETGAVFTTCSSQSSKAALNRPSTAHIEVLTRNVSAC